MNRDYTENYLILDTKILKPTTRKYKCTVFHSFLIVSAWDCPLSYITVKFC